MAEGVISWSNLAPCTALICSSMLAISLSSLSFLSSTMSSSEYKHILAIPSMAVSISARWWMAVWRAPSTSRSVSTTRSSLIVSSRCWRWAESAGNTSRDFSWGSSETTLSLMFATESRERQRNSLNR